jgi:ATP synthase protein I
VEPTESVAINASSEGDQSVAAQATTISSDGAMTEYVKLKRELYITFVVIGIVVFVSVWLAYELNVALNYLLGAIVGLVYVRMLAREVEKISSEKTRLNNNRLGLFAGVIILAIRVPQLQVLPVFLGFLTYKLVLLIYTLRTVWLQSDRPSSK